MTKSIFTIAEEKGLRIEFALSEHIYLNSIHETYNSCGNCDGANCDSCKNKWSVVNDGELIEEFYDKDELSLFILNY